MYSQILKTIDLHHPHLPLFFQFKMIGALKSVCNFEMAQSFLAVWNPGTWIFSVARVVEVVMLDPLNHELNKVRCEEGEGVEGGEKERDTQRDVMILIGAWALTVAVVYEFSSLVVRGKY